MDLGGVWRLKSKEVLDKTLTENQQVILLLLVGKIIISVRAFRCGHKRNSEIMELMSSHTEEKSETLTR